MKQIRIELWVDGENRQLLLLNRFGVLKSAQNLTQTFQSAGEHFELFSSSSRSQNTPILF